MKQHPLPHSRLTSHFTACAATAAGASLFVVPQAANGAVIYSGTQNATIFATSVNGGVYIDLEPPFQTAQGARGFGWELNPYASGTRLYLVPDGNEDHPAGALGTRVVLSGPNAANLAVGATIDGSAAFSGPGFYGGTNIPNGQTGLIGFSFDPDGAAGNQTWYGWFRMTVDTVNNGKVVDWAYENSGAAIAAGAVPEPGSLALLACGLAGLGRRRRKA